MKDIFGLFNESVFHSFCLITSFEPPKENHSSKINFWWDPMSFFPQKAVLSVYIFWIKGFGAIFCTNYCILWSFCMVCKLWYDNDNFVWSCFFFMISVGKYDFECWHVWSSSLSTIFNSALNQDSRSVKVYPFRWAAVTWVMLSYASFQQKKMKDIKPEQWICVVTTTFCHQNPALTQLCRKLSRCLWQPKMLVTQVCTSTFQFGCQWKTLKKWWIDTL